MFPSPSNDDLLLLTLLEGDSDPWSGQEYAFQNLIGSQGKVNTGLSTTAVNEESLLLQQGEQLKLLQNQLLQQHDMLLKLQQHHSVTETTDACFKQASNNNEASNNRRRAAKKAARARESLQKTDLEGKLHAVASLHCQLLIENSTLRRRAKLLETGVQLREQHLEALLRSRQSTPHFHIQHHQSKAGQVASASKSDFAYWEPAGGLHQQDLTSAPTCEHSPSHIHPWSDFKNFPDPKTWNTDICAFVRTMSPQDYQRCWRCFVKETSMLAVAAEVHGNKPEVQKLLTQLVSNCLAVTDRFIAINPTAYYNSLYINLITGEPESPGKSYWRDCLLRIQLEPEQIEFLKTSMEEHSRSMTPLLSERSQLTSDLSRQLVLGPVHNHSSSLTAMELSDKLQLNVQKEQVNTGFIIDFLTMEVLSPVQIALLSAAAFPLIPDPTAMAEVALEMASQKELKCRTV